MPPKKKYGRRKVVHRKSNTRSTSPVEAIVAEANNTSHCFSASITNCRKSIFSMLRASIHLLSTTSSDAMDRMLEEYGIYIAIGIGITAVLVVVLACFKRSSCDASACVHSTTVTGLLNRKLHSKKRPLKRQGSVTVKQGSVSEMAQAFDHACTDRVPIMIGRQIRHRVKD